MLTTLRRRFSTKFRARGAVWSELPGAPDDWTCECHLGGVADEGVASRFALWVPSLESCASDGGPVLAPLADFSESPSELSHLSMCFRSFLDMAM